MYMIPPSYPLKILERTLLFNLICGYSFIYKTSAVNTYGSKSMRIKLAQNTCHLIEYQYEECTICENKSLVF